MTDLSHNVSILIDAPAAHAVAFLSDPLALGRWTLGSMHTRPSATPGVVEGESLFDGDRSLIHIEADPPRGLIDYYVGSDPQALKMRISVRVLAGDGLGYSGCVVSLTAWRPGAMDDTRWRQLCAAHAVEILLIKNRIERLAGEASSG